MKIAHVDSPEVTDAACREKTGKTLKQWYAELDGHGGIAKGRRDLVNHVYEHCNKDVWWSTTIVVEYERERGQKEKDGLPMGYSICSTKTVAAPIASVFAAFGDAKLLDQWLGPKTRVNLEEGGTLENGDGDRFTFKRVRPQKDVKFVFERADITPATQVEVLFADKGQGKTGITLNHTRIQTRADADRLREGWSDALAKLKSTLEAK